MGAEGTPGDARPKRTSVVAGQDLQDGPGTQARTDTGDKHIVIDPRLSEYETFFDHDWAKRIDSLAEGTRVENLVLSLCMSWKSIANTQRLPSLMVHSLEWQLSGFMRRDPALTTRLVRLITSHLCKELSGHIPRSAQPAVRRAVEKLGRVAEETKKEAARTAIREYTADRHWSELLETSEFVLSLWGSQRICYGALYHAFEDFSRSCIALALGRADNWRPGGELLVEARTLFGDDFVDRCFCTPQITAARLVRNALAHNGGRMTNELRSVRHGIAIEADILQIMPADNSNLFHMLKVPAYMLVEEMINREYA